MRLRDEIKIADIMGTDQKRYIKLNKEYKDLNKLVLKGEEYKEVVSNLEEAKEIIADGSDDL